MNSDKVSFDCNIPACHAQIEKIIVKTAPTEEEILITFCQFFDNYI